MKKLAFGALLVGLLVACGGGSDSKKVMVIDTAMVDTPMTCNPLTQAGCAAGEKCTWLLDALMPQYVGHIGCAPDGTGAAGDSCMYGAPGATGYDGCAKGNVCGNYRGGTGICKQICDQQGGTPMCAATHVCVTYSGLFSTGDTTPAAGGVCDLACDPIADNDFDGSGAASMKTTATCGANAAVGCYGYPSFGSPPATGWSCTNDINSMEAQPTGLRHRVQCIETNNCADAGPTIYVNSCNQGYLPLLRESTTVSTAICTALCRPQNCWMGNCGTQNVNRIGVSTTGNTNGCKTPDRVGTFFTANDASGGEHCRYIWSFEIDDQGNFLRSPTSDTMGFCFDHDKYLYDSNGDNMPETKYPNCGNLPQSGFGSGTDPSMQLSYWGAADLGCVDTTLAVGLATGKQLPADTLRKVKADLPRALYRRNMGAR
ncbi:MAG TPA: hypothetical protein VIV11_24820 [Kofleriaceae bacterium]